MSGLMKHPGGGYCFLPGIDPYSCGVVAEPGYEMVRVTFRNAPAWREGFERVDAFLQGLGRRRVELCAMELRSPKPFTMEGFVQFNRGYCSVLEDWGVFVGGLNPIARTNVCPEGMGGGEPVLHAFSFVRPREGWKRSTFVVAGAGELLEGTLRSEGIVRRGEVDPEAMFEKARYVCEVMRQRLAGLGGSGEDVSALNVYTVHPFHDLMRPLLLEQLAASRRQGLCWHYTRPPVVDIEFEMDLRGIAEEQLL